MERVTEMHRKSLIRLLKKAPQREKRKRERERTYKSDVGDALRVISESFDYVCGERLQPNLVWMANHLEQHGELETTPALMAQLAENQRLNGDPDSGTIGPRSAAITAKRTAGSQSAQTGNPDETASLGRKPTGTF